MEDCYGFWFMNQSQWNEFFKDHGENGKEKATATMAGHCMPSNMPKTKQIFRCEFETTYIFFEVKQVRIPHDPGDQYFADMYPIKQETK
jgi:hypothetical protein